MGKRIQSINSIAMLLVVYWIVFASGYFSNVQGVSPIMAVVLIYLTSIGFYQGIVAGLFELCDRVPLLLRLYWGRLYVDGIWSYTYTYTDEDDKTEYFGIWVFEQSLYETSVTGQGLSADFKTRSAVRSVTDMVRVDKGYEFINVRTDAVAASDNVYSKTTMYFELSKGYIFRYPIKMHGYTVIYGGPRNGKKTINCFVRHEADTVNEVIEELRQNYLRYGTIHPQHLLNSGSQVSTSDISVQQELSLPQGSVEVNEQE